MENLAVLTYNKLHTFNNATFTILNDCVWVYYKSELSGKNCIKIFPLRTIKEILNEG